MKCNIYRVVLLMYYLIQVALHAIIKVYDFGKEPLDCKSVSSISPKWRCSGGKIIQSIVVLWDRCFPKIASHLTVQFLILKVILLL